MSADPATTGGWDDGDNAPVGPRAGEHPTHHASGLMPAQADAALEEIDPARVAEKDAFGRTPDQR